MICNLGDNQLNFIQSTIESRRAAPVKEKTLWQRASHFFSKSSLPRLVSSNTSLHSLKMQGFLPQDFIEEQVRFDNLKYSIDDLTDFGFTYDDFLEMGIRSDHFSKFSEHNYKNLKIRATEMLRTNLHIHDLIALNLSPQQLHSLGWTLSMFKSIGGTKENLKGMCSDKDLTLYFSHHEMKDMGIKPKIKTKKSSKLKF